MTQALLSIWSSPCSRAEAETELRQIPLGKLLAPPKYPSKRGKILVNSFLSAKEGPSEGPVSTAGLWNEWRLEGCQGCAPVSVERLEPGVILYLRKRLSLSLQGTSDLEVRTTESLLHFLSQKRLWSCPDLPLGCCHLLP